MTQPPDQLAHWVEQLAGQLTATAKRLRQHARPGENQTAADWLPPLLADFAAVQNVGQRAEHVLSAYALRSGILGAARVASLTGVTITAASNRAASKVTREAWPDAFGRDAEV